MIKLESLFLCKCYASQRLGTFRATNNKKVRTTSASSRKSRSENKVIAAIKRLEIINSKKNYKTDNNNYSATSVLLGSESKASNVRLGTS